MGKQSKVGQTNRVTSVLKWILWLVKCIVIVFWNIVRWLASALCSSGSQAKKNSRKEKSPPTQSNKKASAKTKTSENNFCPPCVITSCSYEGCDWSGNIEALADHQEICVWHMVTCKVCGWTGPFCKRKEHKSQCTKAPKNAAEAKSNQPEVRSVPAKDLSQKAPLKTMKLEPQVPAAAVPPKVKANEIVETQSKLQPPPEASPPAVPSKAVQAQMQPAPKNSVPKAPKKKGGEVSCPHEGCQWVGAENSISKHCSICNYRVVNCDKGCEWRGPFLKLEDHYPTCSYRLMFCPQKCGAVFKAKDLDSHICKPCKKSSSKPAGQGHQEIIDRETTARDIEPKTDDLNHFQVAGAKKGKAKKQAAVAKPSSIPEVTSDGNAGWETQADAKSDSTISALSENWPSEKVGRGAEPSPVINDSVDKDDNAFDDSPPLGILEEDRFPSLTSSVKSTPKKLPGRFSKANAASLDIQTGRLKGKQSNVRISATEDCPVCLEPLVIAQCAVLRRCRHQFHAACLEAAAWGATSAGLLCAICRTKFVWNDIEFCVDGSKIQAPVSTQKVAKTIVHLEEEPEFCTPAAAPPKATPAAKESTLPVVRAPGLKPNVAPKIAEPKPNVPPKPAEPKPNVPPKSAEPKPNVTPKPAEPKVNVAPKPKHSLPVPAKATEAIPPRSNWDPRAMPQSQAKSTIRPPPKKTCRLDRQKHLFELLDVDEDGRLNSAEMFRFATITGFPADGDWKSEYELFCEECNCRPNSGITQQMFITLIDDTGDAGCYCEDEEIEEYCRDLAKERDRRAKEAPAPKAKLLSLAEIQQRRAAQGKNLPNFAGDSANRISAPPGLEEEIVDEEQEDDEEEEESDDAFW